jgi:hypothetical protein
MSTSGSSMPPTLLRWSFSAGSFGVVTEVEIAAGEHVGPITARIIR